MFEESINCTMIDPETIICNGTTYKEPEGPLNIHDQLFWIYIGIYCALVLFAGLMSGLTMGLLSLDILSLRVLADGGKPHERKYAKRIMPVVARHHLLLVTLLLANAAAVESMPIFLDRVTDPIIAISVSVTAVLLFGEVFPQAVCTRYGLAIGATLSPLVILLMVLLFPIAWPISKVLDCLLGKNMEPSSEEQVCVKGPYSRLPVYNGPRGNILGILLVKTLLQIDPNTAPTVEQIFKKHGRTLPVVAGNTPLYDLLNEMQTGKCHMAAVLSTMDDPSGQSSPVEGAIQTDSAVPTQGEIIGIITLEDIIEELLQEEIVDETDEFVDVHRRVRVARAKLARMQSITQDVGQTEAGVVSRYQRSASREPVKSPGIKNEPMFHSGKITNGSRQQGLTPGTRPSSGGASLSVPINGTLEDDRTLDTAPLISLE